jgi:hypothetical protein
MKPRQIKSRAKSGKIRWANQCRLDGYSQYPRISRDPKIVRRSLLGACVAGIFRDPLDVGYYLARMPIGECIIINADVRYPFYRLEIGDLGFSVFQTEDEARSHVGSVLYTITEDYQPPIPWTD